jgi:hypothetical protein
MAFDPKVKELIDKAVKEEKEILGEFKIDDFITPDVIEEVYVKNVGKIRFKRLTTADFWNLSKGWNTDGEYTARLISIMITKATQEYMDAPELTKIIENKEHPDKPKIIKGKIELIEEYFNKFKATNPLKTSAISVALTDKMVFLKSPGTSKDGSTKTLKPKTSGS